MCNRAFGLAVLAAVTAVAPGSGRAQDVADAVFEVVSIRPRQPTSEFVMPNQLRVVGNRLEARAITAAVLVRSAYGPEFKYADQIVDGPEWTRFDRFDVDARANRLLSDAPASPIPADAARALQRVLEDRFELRVRRERRDIPVYFLTPVREDRVLKPAIRPSSADCARDSAGPKPECGDRPYSPLAGRFSMRGHPIEDFVRFLEIPAYGGGTPVVNDTGISGNADVELEWAHSFRDLQASGANLFTALREQLGLKLDPRRQPMPVLVIEHIERPTPN